MENAFDVRNPTALLIEAHHAPNVKGNRVVKAIDEELDRVATDGVPGDELERVQARLSSALLQGADHVMSRTLAMASYEQQRGRAELVGEMPALLAAVTADQVATAAEPCDPTRACLDVVPGGAVSPKGKVFAPEVPGLARARTPKLPTVAERVCRPGCAWSRYADRASRRAPATADPTGGRRDADLAKARCSNAPCCWYAEHSQSELAEALQRIGGSLRVSATPTVS
jgi:hypothetical protein